MYPEEPYELDYNRRFPGDSLQKNVQSEKFTSYDLVSAVRRQVPFCFQVMESPTYSLTVDKITAILIKNNIIGSPNMIPFYLHIFLFRKTSFHYIESEW